MTKKTIAYLLFAASSLILPVLSAGVLFHPYGVDGRTDYFTLFTPFFAGAIIAVFNYLISGKSKIFSYGSAIYSAVFSSLGFIAFAFTGKDVVRVLPRSIGAIFTFREMNISQSILKVSEKIELKQIIPVYGYISEIVYGFIIAMLIITFLKNYKKRRTGNNELKFKPIYLLWLVVPIVTAIADFYLQVLFESITKNIFIGNAAWFVKALPVFGFSIMAAIMMFILSSSININKWIVMLGCALSLLVMISIPYISQTEAVENSKVLGYIFGGYSVFMYPLYCGGVLGVSLRCLLSKKALSNA